MSVEVSVQHQNGSGGAGLASGSYKAAGQASGEFFADSRAPDAGRQGKLQELASQSPRVQQLAAAGSMMRNSPRALSLQRKQDGMLKPGPNHGMQARSGEVGHGEAAKAPAVAQAKPVVQCLAGMEVELRIPFYGRAAGVGINNARFITPNQAALAAGERREIINFLYGGLNYGVSYGAVPDHFDISADHTGWRQSHAALCEHIRGTHIADPGPKPEMSNLEYRTEALEERDPAAELTMRQIATEVKDHAVASAALATGGTSVNLNAPVDTRFTGIPVAPLRKLLLNDATGLALLDTMNNTLDPSLYYQTTVGALPSEIPKLFRQAAGDIEAFDPDSAKAALLRMAVAKAKESIEAGVNAAFVATFQEGDQLSLRGWMTLIAQTMLAYQMETTNLRYRSDGLGHLYQQGGTEKNLLPYLSKTLFNSTAGALPAAVRPDLTGPNRADWIGLFNTLRQQCSATNTDMVTLLGLTDHDGQDFHDENNLRLGAVAHGDLLGNQTPSGWLSALLQGLPAGNQHVRTGNLLGLDAGQEALHPGLNIPGEQAIPLEDRASQVKVSFGDFRDIAGTDAILNAAWDAAKARRMGSTALRTTYLTDYGALLTRFQNYGSLATCVPALNALLVRFTALSADPPDLAAGRTAFDLVRADFNLWQAANSNASLALGLLTPLINKGNWSTKGKKLIGAKVPNGMTQMRTALLAGNRPVVTLAALGGIGTARLASGSRMQVTTDMYELARDTPGWIAANGPGWSSFVTKFNATDAGV